MDYIEYDGRPDPTDRRRLGRFRFAAYCLPLLTAASALAWLTVWLSGLVRQGAGIMSMRSGDALAVFVLAVYLLVRGQDKLLERRCNDAGRGWFAAEWLCRIGGILAVTGVVLPVTGVPLVLVLLAQFVYGNCLPANPHPNLSGAPRPDGGWVRFGAVLAYAAAAGIVILLLRGV